MSFRKNTVVSPNSLEFGLLPRAVTNSGEASPDAIQRALETAARRLNVSPLDVPTRIEAMVKEVASLEEQATSGPDLDALSADSLIEAAEDVGGVSVIVAETPGANPNLMRQLIDQIRKKVSPSAVLLATVAGEKKVVLVAGLTRDLVERGASAGQWVEAAAKAVGGGGGGRPDMAQAGGKQPEKLPEALAAARASIREMLAG